MEDPSKKPTTTAPAATNTDGEIAGILIVAMSKAVMAVAGELKLHPSIMASAITGFTANFLASIDDDKERRLMRQSMQNLLPIVMAQRVSEEKKRKGIRQ